MLGGSNIEEREAWKSVEVYFVRGKSCSVSGGVVVGRRDGRRMYFQSVCCSFLIIESMWTNTRLKGSTPPLVERW